jgi:hypothetical protein
MDNCLVTSNIANLPNGQGTINIMTGRLTMTNSTISNNTGILTSALIMTSTGSIGSQISNCPFSSNIATGTTLNIRTSSEFILFSSTMSNNNTGPILTLSSPIANLNFKIFNTTISNNTIVGNNTIIYGTRNMIFINSTICNNISNSIILGSGTRVNFANTVSALNTVDISGTIISLGFNFIGNGDLAIGTVFENFDQVGSTGSPLDPLLLPLNNYGGPHTNKVPNGNVPINQ